MKPDLSAFESVGLGIAKASNPDNSPELSRQAARCTARGFSTSPKTSTIRDKTHLIRENEVARPTPGPPSAEKDSSRTALALRRTAFGQMSEEAAIERRSRRLLATLIRNGRADGEDQAEIMLQLLRGRKRMPSGNFVATMALSGRLAGRRRVSAKSNTNKGKRWSKGLHPGLWTSEGVKEQGSSAAAAIYRAAETIPDNRNIGIIAVR